MQTSTSYHGNFVGTGAKIIPKRNANSKVTSTDLYLGIYSRHCLHLGMWLSILFLIQLKQKCCALSHSPFGLIQTI